MAQGLFGAPTLTDYFNSHVGFVTATIDKLDPAGRAVPYGVVEARAREAGVSIRGGCFCNPGASEVAFGFPAGASADCLRSSAAAGFTIARFASCLGPDVPVGAVRASFGLATNVTDVRRAMAVIASFGS